MTRDSSDPAESSASSETTKRSRRAGRGTLTREEVVSAAVKLIDAEGLEMLTMRRLGQRVGRDAMSLYRYAANRNALLDEVVEAVLSELPPFSRGRPWQEELRNGAHAFRLIALAHPNVVPLLVTRPLLTPLGLRPLGVLRTLEGILALLTDQGFSPVEALRAYRSYMVLLNGHILNELQEAVVDHEESLALLRLGLHRLPARDFPKIRELAEILADYDGAAELDRGMDAFFHGLGEQLDGRPRAAPPPSTNDDDSAATTMKDQP